MAGIVREVKPTSRARAPIAAVQSAPVARWMRPNFAGLEPAQLKGIINALQRGDVEDWAYLCHHMERLDGHLKSLIDTRRNGVASADFTVEPNELRQSPYSDAAADLCARALAMAPNTVDVFSHLLWAEDVGWSAAEHDWSRVDGEYHSTPRLIHVADFMFGHDWRPLVRGYGPVPDESTGLVLAESGRRGAFYWIDVNASNPNAFMVHVPGEGDSPNLCGDLLSVAWTWLFKRNVEIFRQVGLERLSTPLILGLYDKDSANDAEDALFTALQNLSADHVGVLEASEKIPDPIKLIEPGGKVGEGHTDTIKHLDEQMSKAMLGSTLAVEVGANGGAYSAAESQFSTTILPRLWKFATRLARTIEKQWFEPTLRLNAHLFGGTVPPTPRLVFRLVNEEAPQITQLHIDAAAVDVDELRVSAGLEPWGPERGGDRIVQPLAKTTPDLAPMSMTATTDGTVTDDAPFSAAARRSTSTASTTSRRATKGSASGATGRQMTLPLTTSRTSSRFRRKIASVPFD